MGGSLHKAGAGMSFHRTVQDSSKSGFTPSGKRAVGLPVRGRCTQIYVLSRGWVRGWNGRWVHLGDPFESVSDDGIQAQSDHKTDNVGSRSSLSRVSSRPNKQMNNHKTLTEKSDSLLGCWSLRTEM